MTPFAWLRWTIKAVAVLVAAVLAVTGFTAYRVWSVAREDHRGQADVVLVLGASQFNGRPSEVFAARLKHAAELYRQKVAPRVVTVGGKRKGDVYTEAQAGSSYLITQGVPSSAVLAVGKGSDTLTSLQAAANVMRQHGWHSAVIVTDPWHSLRSRRIARDEGIDAQTSPTRTGPANRSRATEWHYVLRETAAYLYYRVFHRSSDSGDHAV
ncbi:MAG: hypothetical protein QOK42_1761 [Frankiaceae bacterium]|nr:hypothetical protein [Frankiaceae bacterium]MDX6225803.1 hypothetical protein [Frankiales bacterium]